MAVIRLSYAMTISIGLSFYFDKQTSLFTDCLDNASVNQATLQILEKLSIFNFLQE